MSVLALEEHDEFDDALEDLEELQRGFLSLENKLSEFGRKSEQFKQEGICRSDAVALEMLDPDLISPNYPVNSFTVVPSKTNLTVTQESLWNSTQRVFEAVWNLILDLFEKISEALKAIKSKAFSKNPKADATKANKDLQKTKDAFEKEEKRIRDQLEKRLSDEQSKNAELQRKLDEVLSYRSPAMAEASDLARSSYTRLARIIVTNPKLVEKMCEQFNSFPSMVQSIVTMTESLKDALNRAADNGHINVDYIQNIRQYEHILRDIYPSFGAPIKALYELIPEETFPRTYNDDNLGSTYELTSELRANFRKAATEPSGKTIEDDFGDDITPMLRNRDQSIDALSKALAVTKELEILQARASEADKSLKRIKNKARSVEIEGSHAKEIRELIINHAKGIRSYSMSLLNMRICLNYLIRATERNVVATARLYALGANELRRLR